MQFYHLLDEASKVPVAPDSEEKQFSEETFNQIAEVFSRGLNPETTAPPFAGDLENKLYLQILQAMRDFKPELYEVQPEQDAQ